jgi:hypothetical protein
VSRRPTLPIDAGLWNRFEAAGAKIAWRPVIVPRPGTRSSAVTPRSRIAHLHDEEARVEERPSRSGFSLLVESGPVGALVILLEAGVRGVPSTLQGVEGAVEPQFPSGAIRALWGRTSSSSAGTEVSLTDLVELARYALR